MARPVLHIGRPEYVRASMLGFLMLVRNRVSYPPADLPAGRRGCGAVAFGQALPKDDAVSLA